MLKQDTYLFFFFFQLIDLIKIFDNRTKNEIKINQMMILIKKISVSFSKDDNSF